MSKAVRKEHSLSAFMQEHGAKRVAAPGVSVVLEPDVYHVNVRIDPDDGQAVAALASVVSTTLPQPGRVERGEATIYWLGPKEFLIVGAAGEGRDLVVALSNAFKENHAAATDLSGGQILLAVAGSSVREFLSKASTLDLHEQAFALNRCAQSTFAKTGALYALRDADVFELVIRRSFADYAARWMLHAGQEFGIVFEE